MTTHKRMEVEGKLAAISLRWTHGLPDKRLIDAVLFNHVASPRAGGSWVPGVEYGFLYISNATPAENPPGWH
jgi:hypothetical protein